MSFEKINYKGNEILRDVVDDSTGVAYYQHIYRITFDAKDKGRHMCLQWGSWCWKQAREHPIEAVKFLTHHRLNK